MTDPIKAKIIELCPDVMTLKYGCSVLEGDRKATVLYLETHQNNLHDLWLLLHNNEKVVCRSKLATDELEEYVIVGSPITLAVVLRAIDNVLVIVDAWGNIYKMSMKLNQKYPVLDPENGTERWNLEHDNYDAQSQETKDFISSLLNV